MLDNKARYASPRPVDIHIGARAAARRRTLGLSPMEVAQVLDVDSAVLGELERGRRRFLALQLWALSRHLRVPMAWFFDLPDEARYVPLQ